MTDWQMTGYARKFDENPAMSFRVNNKQLLKNYNKIWVKVKKLMRKDRNWELYWWRFKKHESDSDSNDETESDIDNDEYDK